MCSTLELFYCVFRYLMHYADADLESGTCVKMFPPRMLGDRGKCVSRKKPKERQSCFPMPRSICVSYTYYIAKSKSMCLN